MRGIVCYAILDLYTSIKHCILLGIYMYVAIPRNM